jgi:N6-L-threonylcarbamoyladenine synthase
MKLLGIESSCDETAAAVITDEGIASSVLFSQIQMHHQYGGVVPELASRSHLEKIMPIVTQALQEAGVSLTELDAIAVTTKPGLPGSLLVGVSFAKALAAVLDIPLIAVDHIQGHAYSACIENPVSFPSLVLTASGGHTSLQLLEGALTFQTIGHTVDDAAGEAFDKIAKLFGIAYPGGPKVEARAQRVNFADTRHYPRLKEPSLNFSFSGLKTAVLYDLVAAGAFDMKTKQCLIDNDDPLIDQVCSSALVAVGDIFCDRLKRALKQYPHVKSLCFVGGVACNTYLRQRLTVLAQHYNLPFYTPSKQYCTDNAAMIAYVGKLYAEAGLFSSLESDILQ